MTARTDILVLVGIPDAGGVASPTSGRFHEFAMPAAELEQHRLRELTTQATKSILVFLLLDLHELEIAYARHGITLSRCEDRLDELIHPSRDGDSPNGCIVSRLCRG